MATYLRYLGKVVIVTGGTRGIGPAIVREFVRQGAKVVFCSQASEVETGHAIQRELQDSGCPGEAYFHVCDVRNETEIKRLILVTVERYGCLDCLVNAAGDVYSEKIDDVTAQSFRNLMEMNVVSYLLTSKYALPYLRETRGNIINLACICGVIGAKHTVSNVTSKGAVIAMTKALAIDESKYGVRVNSLSPGNIWTPLSEKMANQSPDPEAAIQEIKDRQLMGRYGTPEEVALGVLYLAADGTFCTGFNLMISGGAEVGFGKKSEVDPEPGPSMSRMESYLRYPGKVVIVTGGTSGIGLASVREFVRQGAKVVFCSRARGAKKGQAIQRELQDSGCPGEAFYQVCDVRQEADIKRLILATIEHYGCLDCLVNTVGEIYYDKIDDVNAQDFCNLMKVNVVSSLLASKYSLPYLRETRGNIINIASLAGVYGVKNLLSYTTSKGAVIAMTKALAIDESKYGVRVNCISPSGIWTPFLGKLLNQLPDPEAAIQETKDLQLMGRLGTPEEVALGILYLAADGTFCTGFNLMLSGGAEVGFGKKSEVDPQHGPSVSGSSQDSSRK
ncbi:uncharacterized short-chain type dehydrogenase/reductase y4vI-like [Eublepharis macularius]|uniref:Uncharacterized short-chain type dehydrogenase/reductase y4vI-like n=1 Tax=Eublepharis macularius TaxID=481883 RepID=A0AA97LF98_EUBMA|nr:uncharacterized short-chain type dehydrogenase/reductase y4vI-like [Eublepharis macularius]